jgi:Carboxypeptidase regulatory-like domain
MKEIDPPADLGMLHVDLQVRFGAKVRFRVVDDEGRPCQGVKPLGRTSRGSSDREALTSAEGDVTNLYANEERTVAFLVESRKIGKVIRVREGDDRAGPVVVKLEPLASISGRVVNAEGAPVTGATIRPDLLPGGDYSLRLSEVSTDVDGRFLVTDVPTGCEYSLAADSREEMKKRRFAFSEKLTVRPGKTTDAGEIRFKRD